MVQLQNSRTVIQERDRFIRDLEEKVDFLEAEVRITASQSELITTSYLVLGRYILICNKLQTTS